jgi:glycosyltransferase involved in cell wall biosynthesis
MDLSIVMSTFNRATMLPETLAGIREAGRHIDVDWEIVVVDNNSTDGTRVVIERAAREDARIRYVFEPRQGVCFGRNTAVEASRGAVVLVTDDDVVVGRDWLRVGYQAFANNEVGWVMGRILPLWSVPPPRWIPAGLTGPLGLCDLGDTVLELGTGSPYLPMTANMGVRRDIYLKLGGLDPALGPRGRAEGAHGYFSGEDYEFGLRLIDAGHRGRYLPDMIVRNRLDSARLTKRYFRRWMFGNGKAESIMSRGRESHLRRWLGVPRTEFRRAAEVSASWLGCMLRGRLDGAFEHELHLRAFVGFVSHRWTGRI